MANCPKCKEIVKWDFCQDTYRIGKASVFCNDTEMADHEGREAIVYTCLCGEVLGVQVDEGYVYNHKEFKDVEWDSDEHCHEEC